MNTIEFTVWLTLGSVIAGFLGALTGLGGGVVIVPLLVVVFGVDIHYAVGAALISVIATSSGAAAAYVKEGYSNVRVGMFLEVATTAGALIGAHLAGILPGNIISVIFGIVLLASAVMSHKSKDEMTRQTPNPLATWLNLDGTFPTPNGKQAYCVGGVPGGFALMLIAGGLSGLLGIGSGALKVLAMDRVMGLPFKVSTTTSNFMIGVTAAASAGIYLRRGQIDPSLVMPVVLGVLIGALVGSKILANANPRILRIVFTFVILALSAQMIYNGFKGTP